MSNTSKKNLKKDLFVNSKEMRIFMGSYDVFSSQLVASMGYDIFCSGYSFTASHYCLPDNGFMHYNDLCSLLMRIRSINDKSVILVDVDDGFGDENICADVIRKLELSGADAVMIEDQIRPKKCGHLDGKKISNLDDYLKKLSYILENRKSIFVLARTDTADFEDAKLRVKEFKNTGSDAIMVEGIESLKKIEEVVKISDNIPLAVNIINGGKTNKEFTLSNLKKIGVKMVLYSTPCLFAAHKSIEQTLNFLKENDGLFADDEIKLNYNLDFLKKFY